MSLPSATRRVCSASARLARSRSEAICARFARSSAPPASRAACTATTSSSHQPYERPGWGRHSPRMACPAAPAAATQAATLNRRTSATCSVAAVAAGVAAGEIAASTASASAA